MAERQSVAECVNINTAYFFVKVLCRARMGDIVQENYSTFNMCIQNEKLSRTQIYPQPQGFIQCQCIELTNSGILLRSNTNIEK